MSLNKAAAAAVKKKLTLLDESFARFAVRSTLAGVYLAIGTAFAGVVGMGVEKHAAGLGPLVFAALFGLGLFAIVILGAELATSNMMYMVYGAVKKHVGWGKALWLLVVTTLFNLIGVVLFAAAMSVSAKLGNMDPSHLIATMSAAKLEKSPGGLLVEAMAANFVVNMAIIGAISAKELLSKFFVIVPIIACFVGLSLEHVIANFCLMLLTAFCASPLPEGFTFGAVLANWSIVWVGNLIGGGFLIGGVYAWLNSGPEAYRD
ncbi:formate/nitrite transporter family protein [Corynebacterium hiratae]|uniref:Formate/nitrite transporter family protein n=1 Tax=Corynebacterium hiratae TaxID=3139423 RepID=A0A553G031_9CORY|nr:formate/nitrite transporter family protein [Corynebacterium aurimucosum]TRX62859.1 formate/nitrite transporter family protein [Corynebacterium aurimucosum]